MMKLIARRLIVYPKAFGGQPVPFGSERFETDTLAVINVGRFASYGDFVTRHLVQLDSGEIAQVVSSDQPPDTAKWLRQRFRVWKTMPVPTRDNPWGTVWER